MRRRHKLGGIGDVNPIEYGGGPVYYVHDMGKRYVYAEYTHGTEQEHPGYNGSEFERAYGRLKLTVYRVDVQPDVLDDLSWCDNHWGSIASTGSNWAGSLVRYSAHPDPMKRVWLYEAVASHFGWHELDSDPLILTVSELRRRWRGLV